MDGLAPPRRPLFLRRIHEANTISSTDSPTVPILITSLSRGYVATWEPRNDTLIFHASVNASGEPAGLRGICYEGEPATWFSGLLRSFPRSCVSGTGKAPRRIRDFPHTKPKRCTCYTTASWRKGRNAEAVASPLIRTSGNSDAEGMPDDAKTARKSFRKVFPAIGLFGNISYICTIF